MDNRAVVEQNEIFVSICGSNCFGTSMSTSDVDVRGVFIATPINRIGLYPVEQVKMEGDDSIHYEIATLFKHLLNSGTNMIELLFIAPQFHRVHGSFWQIILASRRLFLSRQMGLKAIGYMSGMLKRNQHCKAAKDPAVQNELRKQASNAVRTGRMITEALLTGELRVYRGDIDAEHLLAIKTGVYNIDAAWDECEALIESMKENIARSPLPDQPNSVQANELLLDITTAYWREKCLI